VAKKLLTGKSALVSFFSFTPKNVISVTMAITTPIKRPVMDQPNCKAPVPAPSAAGFIPANRSTRGCTAAAPRMVPKTAQPKR